MNMGRFMSYFCLLLCALHPCAAGSACGEQLSEFSPRNPGLLGLNVNRGAEVKIRLRPARDEESFYDWNHILGTMLHEVGSWEAVGICCHQLFMTPCNSAISMDSMSVYDDLNRPWQL